MQMETNLTIELVKMLLTTALGVWLIAHTFENKWVNGFMKFIAKRLGVDRTSIHRAIHTANDLGMLSWVRLSYLGERPQNSYCWQGLCPDAKPAWVGNPEEYEVRGRSKDRANITAQAAA